MVASNLNVPTFTPFNGHEKAQLKRPFPFSVSQPLIPHKYRLNKQLSNYVTQMIGQMANQSERYS